MAVRIRLKKLGRRHRPFFRVCVMDGRVPRDGRVIEEVGYYDPMVRETDARAVLNGERIDYWLGVGAKPTEKVGVLIKKYGTDGTHLEKQRQAIERLKLNKPTAPPPIAVPKAKTEEEARAEEEAAPEAQEPVAAEAEAAPQAEAAAEAESTAEPQAAPQAEAVSEAEAAPEAEATSEPEAAPEAGTASDTEAAENGGD